MSYLSTNIHDVVKVEATRLYPANSNSIQIQIMHGAGSRPDGEADTFTLTLFDMPADAALALFTAMGGQDKDIIK